MSRRWRFAGVAAVLVAAAVAIPVASSAGATASGNLARAQGEAAQLLALLHVPPGAVELTSKPSVLRSPSYEEATPNLVDAHHWWKVQGKAANVMSYVTARMPKDAKFFGSSGSAGSGPLYSTDSYALPSIPGVLSERVLAVSVAQVSPSTAILRTDGEAVWVVPRPASEQLPAGIDEIDISSKSFMTQAPIVSLKVTNGAKVRQIVKWVNAMAIVQPGVIACPLLAGPTVTLVFRTAGGRRVARASGMDLEGSSGACNGLDLRLLGRSQPALVGDLFERMQRLLGVRFERSGGQGPDGSTGTAVMAPTGPAARTARADHVTTRDVLRGNGIGALRFGASPTAVRTAIDSLLGQSGGGYKPGGSCEVDHEITWWDQWTASGEPALTVYFRHSAFAGYQLGDAIGPSVLRRPQGGWSLATTRGLRVGDKLKQGRRLYGHEFTLSFAQGGSWELQTAAGRFVGYAWGTPPPSVDVSWQSYVATIDAGDVGCPAMTP